MFKILAFIFMSAIVACTPIGAWAAGFFPDDWAGAAMSSETQYMIGVVATIAFILMVFRAVFWVVARVPFVGHWICRQIIRATLWAYGHKGKKLLRDSFVLMVWKDIGGKGQPSSAVIYNRVWGIQSKPRKPKKIEQRPARRQITVQPANDVTEWKRAA